MVGVGFFWRNKHTEAFVRYPLLPEAKINGRLFHGSVGNQIDSVRDTFYRDRACNIKSELGALSSTYKHTYNQAHFMK